MDRRRHLVRRRPRLRLLDLTCRIVDHNPGGATSEFERIERQVRDAEGPPDEVLGVDLELARCVLLIDQAERQVRFSPWPVLAQTTKLARTQAAEDPRTLALALPIEIFMLHRYGPVERCERRTREMEAIHAEGGYTYNSPWIWMYRARNALAHGELEQAERHLRHLLHDDAVFINYRQDSVGQLAAVLLGRIAYLRGDIEAALNHLSPIAAERTVTLLELLVGAHVDAAVCEFALGNAEGAFEMLDVARHLSDDDELPHLGLIAAATQIELLARAGKGESMAAAASQIGLAELWLTALEPYALPWLTVDALARARFECLIGSGDAAGASAVAESLRKLAQTTGHRLSEVTALIMAARAAALADPPRVDVPELEQALALGAACGVVQTFLDASADTMTLLRGWLACARATEAGAARRWAQRVLDAWDQQFRSRAQTAVATTLTRREIDVLCELAKERSTKLIARTLMLSPETVKHHLKGVYAKLGVKGREEAVVEARKRMLIP